MAASVEKIALAANRKLNLAARPFNYLIACIFAGVFVGVGVISAFTSGALVNQFNPFLVPIVMGLAFSMALTFILMSDSELFTANHFIFTVSYLFNKVNLKQAGKIWAYSLVGNILGSLLIAVLIWGALKGQGGVVLPFFHKATEIKLNMGVENLLFRSILCNMLVCTAVMLSFRLKSEMAKITVNAMCLFVFIACGFEHCIADAIIFFVSVLDAPTVFNLFSVANTLGIIILGNFIGGAMLLGGGYAFKYKGIGLEKDMVLKEKAYNRG